MHNFIGRILQDMIKYIFPETQNPAFFPNFKYLFDILRRLKRSVFCQDIVGLSIEGVVYRAKMPTHF